MIEALGDAYWALAPRHLQVGRFRREVEAKASNLLAVHGTLAYAFAREESQMDRAAGRFTDSGF